jgi:hypothetical protein
MKVDVTTATTIARPKSEVAAFACDPERIPLWYQNIKLVEWKTEPPLRIGTQLAFVAQFLGRRLAYTYEVVEHTPGERFVMRTAEGPFPMETTYTWDAAGDGQTRMTVRNLGTPRGFGLLAAPFLGLAMRRALTKDLALLKAILERRAGRPPVA